jgi:predicted enzyme related to lactoylglutathione lyase
MFYNRNTDPTLVEEIPMSKRNVVHVEIPAANVQAAGKFYQELLGWKIHHDDQMNYSMWEAGDGSGGGFPEVSTDLPAGQVLVYIDSDDIDADLKKVEQLGGKVVKPKSEIPQTGWYAFFQDPTGNMIGLYTSMHPQSNQ